MNAILKSSKAITFLSVFLLLFLGTSCKDEVRDTRKTSETYNRCDLITADDIRSVFNLDQSVAIEKTIKLKDVCYYKWNPNTQTDLRYSIRFTFSRWKQKSAPDMDKAWENQNNSVYKDYNMKIVHGVGDRASWSDYEKGQLRVTEDGYIFYISLYAEPESENSMNTEELIDKASALAKRIIKKM